MKMLEDLPRTARLENSDVVIENVHDPNRCLGTSCPVHNRSNHHMRTWPQNLRTDWGKPFMERICPHGVGHPDPDDPYADQTHGCDGCCAPPRPQPVSRSEFRRMKAQGADPLPPLADLEKDMIPMTDCIPGEFYRVQARNFSYALCMEDKSFNGIRHKWGNTFIDTEFHWDTGAPHGTVKPLQRIELTALTSPSLMAMLATLMEELEDA